MEKENDSSCFLSVVIPAYNEEKRIEATLKRIVEFLRSKAYTWEILVVDDGSKDKTIEVAKNSVPDAAIKIVKNPVNMGKGATIKNGLLAANGAFRLFSDADLSTPIEELDKMLPFAQAGYGVVIGSRALRDSKLEVRQPFYREMMGRTFNLIVRLLVIGNIKDTQCGFKLFTAAAAEKIFRLQQLSGFSFDVEILYLAKKLGFKIKEAPVRWINSTASKVSPIKDSAKMFLDIVKIRFFLRYKK